VKHLMVLALTMFVCGCSAVLSGSPMGGQVQRADPSAWDGVWASLDSGEEETVNVHVFDADAGVLQVEYAEHDKPVQRRVLLRSWRQWTFFNVACVRSDVDECEDAHDRFLWAAYDLRDGVLVMWVPNAARFGDLVDQGLLPGERVGSDVELSTFEDRHYELITSDEHADLWHWREPVLSKRIALN
jgi:hypothetical protein